jgi:hypothetical protein
VPGVGNPKGDDATFCGTGIDCDLLALLRQASRLRDGHTQKKTAHKKEREKDCSPYGPDQGFSSSGKKQAHMSDLPFVNKECTALLR